MGDFFPADQNFGPPPPTSQGLPIPLDAFVIAQPPLVPSPSLGVPIVAAPGVDVSSQDLESANVVDVLVTGSGNFESAGQPTLVSFTISKVDSFDVGLPTERYKLTLGAVNLFNLGVDLTTLLMTFNDMISQQPPIPSAGPSRPVAVNSNPTRPIVSFDTNWVVINAFDSLGFFLGGTFANPWGAPPSTPTAGQHVQIGVIRDGASVINDTNLAAPINVNPSLGPPPVPGVPNVFL